jgi:Uma2 family endonuclease
VSPILEIPEARQRVSPISVEEYRRLNEFNENGRRTELIRGVVFDKTSKSPLHASVAQALYDYLISVVPKGFTVRHENPLTLRDSEPEPDLAVVRGSKEDFYRVHPSTAELVIEVAVTSPALDRANASIYAEAGVKEYRIVLAHGDEVEIFRQPEGGRYLRREVVPATSKIACESLPGVAIRLDQFLPKS